MRFLAAALCFLATPMAAQNCDNWLKQDFWVSAGQAQVIKCLETRRAEEHNDNGATAIHLAAAHSANPAVLAALVHAGADLYGVDMRQNSLLHMAVKSENRPEIILALVALGLGVETREFDGMTALHLAANNANETVLIDALLHAGADIDAMNYFGQTPLQFASFGDATPEILHRLILAGADVNHSDEFNNTAMHGVAGAYLGIEKAAILVAAGADINAQEVDGFTVLHMAAEYGNAEDLLELIYLGADPALQNSGGIYPYDRAVRRENLRGTEALFVMRLASLGPQPVVCDYWVGYEFWHEATLEKVQTCLPYNRVNSAAHYGETPLQQAIGLTDGLKIAQILIAEGADVNARNDADFTALHVAAALDLLDIAKFLLENGADLHAQDLDDRTPLHLATERNGMTQTARYLISIGSDPDALDIDGRRAGVKPQTPQALE